MKTHLLTFVLAGLAFFSHVHAELRTWTNKSGVKIEAEMTGLDKAARTVTIKRANGQEFVVPIDSLSPADVAFIETAKAPPAAPGAKIRYTLDKDAMVTLNITRPDGWVVRELLVGTRQSAGAHELSWDGRDNLGYLLPPGPYQSRMVTHDGITWDYVTSVGNGGTPPWPTPDRKGGWGGNHGQNMAVAVDASGAYLGWISTEGPGCILKRSHDGTKGIWTTTLGPFEGVACLATDGTHLYGVNGTRLLVLDKSTGGQIATLDIKAGPPGDVTAPIAPEFTKFSWNFATHQPPPKGDPLVWGLAAGGGRVYVSLPWRDVVEVFEVSTNAGVVALKLKPEENITVAKPAGLALDGKGNLLVVSASEKRVMQFDLKTRQSKPVLKDLQSPFALTRADSGAMFVTETAPVNQIKKFSSDGRLLGTFGTLGGPVGSVYAPESYMQPCALAMNPDGSVWFVDDQFKRIGIISSEGKPLYAGFGSVNYAADCAINPNDPNEVFTSMWGDLTFRIDYTKPGVSQPGRLLPVKWKGESKGFKMNFGANRLLSHNNRTYVWTGSGNWNERTLSIVEKDHLRPVMYFYPRIVEEGPVAELAKQRGVKSRGWNCDPTVWCDLNDDGAVQDEEIQFMPIPGATHSPQYFGFGYGDMMSDFTLITYGYTWKPKEFTAGGTPVFRGEDIKVSQAHNPVVSWYEECMGAMTLPNGGFCGFSHANDHGLSLGQGFWSGRSSGEAIRGYDADWKYLWRVGQKARRGARPGEIYYMTRSIGTMEECAFFSDVEGCVHVVHQDGFYLQRVLQDGWHTRAVGPDVIGIENFSGSLFKHPQTGRRYLNISSSEATHLFELKGFESIRVSPPQSFTLAAAFIAPEVVQKSAKGEYQILRVPEGSVPMADHQGGALPQSGLNWVTDVAPLIIYRDGRPAGEVRMLYDKENLYVLGHSLDNRAEDTETLPLNAEIVGGNPLTAGETMVVLLSAPSARFRYVFSKVSTLGARVVIQSDGSDKWKAAPRATSLGPTPYQYAMPYRNGASYHLIIPLAGVLPAEDLKAPVQIKMDTAFLSTDPATKKATISYWVGKDPSMQNPADVGFTPEGWGTAVFMPQAVKGDSSATAVAQKSEGLTGAANRWKTARSYAIGGLPLADAPASFQVAWDETNFYAQVKVSDPTPLQNRASVPEMLFKGGDAVSLVFGKAGTEGTEQRIVLAEVERKTKAILYRPVSATKTPYTFKSPVSTETFEHVAPLAKSKITFTRFPAGYVADIAIPWSELGYTAASKTIPFDVQVISSSGAGNTNASCAWWRSVCAEAHANNDIPTEARLYPEQWGRLILEAR
ncbi:FlgD immunoglobulin-like domain containing protein [Prosthecobacter sp.]|uniref:FlgD immunoglobulin-like domain containing protein n=1 Tax=Prosthecobacter sp. TaxID=1965333 RepID=UPI002AB8DF3F|nr:FlgD immunoglobulin-like domain containing protein [Prosthecobacter sp.]MDZ4401392.1 FlgD immunoglobulin-like domain containing protein [Prosthecobacter sp.]